VVVVFQSVGVDRLRTNQFGDIMVTTFSRLGAVGAVTDGGIRDLAGMRLRAPEFQMFAAGAVPAGGVSMIVDVGVPVEIFGLTIRPGELLHGDANGLISVPLEIADRVAAEGRKVLEKERDKIEFLMSDDFSVERLAERSGWGES
jgi:regulator of RNase E activity RraA